MNRLVCDCLNINEDKIHKAYKEYNGDIEKIKEKTQITLACGRCNEEECRKVDITFPKLIEEIESGIWKK